MTKEALMMAALAAGHAQPAPMATIARQRLTLRSETVAVLSAGTVHNRGPVFGKSWCRTDCPCDPPPVPTTGDR